MTTLAHCPPSCISTVCGFDVRGATEYARGHRPGFRHAPGGQLVQETDLHAPVRGARLVLSDDDGIRAPLAAAWLAQMGWEVAILPPDADVLWQTGATDVAGLPIAAHATVPADDLASAVSSADVVVAHSGTGSAITAMDAGKCAVLLPRRRTYREHVDDHQTQIADELDRRGLAIRCEVEDLTADTLRRARERSVETVSNPEAFRLLRDPIS